MRISEIVKRVNEKLAGETLLYSQLEVFLDEVVDDINAKLNSKFPAFSTIYTAEALKNDVGYDYFPEKYIRTVVVIGAAYKFFCTDEEGLPSAQQYAFDYNTNLFIMERDYSALVPEEYQASGQGYVSGPDLNNNNLPINKTEGQYTYVGTDPVYVAIQGYIGPQGPRGPVGPTGPVGPQGASFKYEDFTPEQLEDLRGPQGPIGPVGPQGPEGPAQDISGKVDKVEAFGLTLMEPTFDDNEDDGYSWDKVYFETKPYIPGEDITHSVKVYSADGADKKFVEKVDGKGLSTNDFTNADKQTLEDTRYDADALIEAVTALENQTNNKVDKEVNKGLSSNDFTNEHKAIVENVNGAFKNLGTWTYVYNCDTDEETTETTSPYSSFNNALDNAKETGIYRLKKSYVDIYEGERNVWNIEDCLLFVVKGKDGYSNNEVVQQMLFAPLDAYGEEYALWSIPRLRTYYYDVDGSEEFRWTAWSNMGHDINGTWHGFENSNYKLDSMDDWSSVDYEGAGYYPTVHVVAKYVEEKLSNTAMSGTDIYDALLDVPESSNFKFLTVHEPSKVADSSLIDFISTVDDEGYSWECPTVFFTNSRTYGNLSQLDKERSVKICDMSVISRMYHSLTSRIANLESKVAVLENKLS